MDHSNVRPLHTPRCILNVRGSNRLLTLLPRSDYARIMQRMEPHCLTQGEVIYEAGKPLSHVYFPLTAVASVLVPMQDGESVEAATIGNEGMVGLPVFLGACTSTDDAVAQVAGEALRMTTSAFTDELHGKTHFADLLRLYAQGYITQISQSSACNRRHPVDQRLCRWC